MYPLFVSSLLMVVGNVPFIIISQNNILMILYTTGLVTSCLNHYYQSKCKTLQILDRTVMTVGACIDLVYMDTLLEFILWYSAIYFYFFSKTLKIVGFKDTFHMFSHFLVKLLHNQLLYNNFIEISF